MNPELKIRLRDALPKYNKHWAKDLYEKLQENGITKSKTYMYMVLNADDPRSDDDIEKIAIEYLEFLVKEHAKNENKILELTK